MELSLPDLPGGGPFSVSRWRRQAGERVSAGEVLLEVVSPRFDWDIPAPADGVLETLVAPGATVAAGERLALIGGAESPAPRRVRISPLAAHLAAEHGVALERLPAGRRITRADVLVALETRQAPATDTLVAWTAAQRERAARSVQAAREVPHGTLMAALDLHAAAAARAALLPGWQKRESAPLDLLAFVLHGALSALIDVPECNALMTEAGAQPRRVVHAALVLDDGESPPRAGVIEDAGRYNAIGLVRRLALLQPGGATAGGTLTIRARPALLATDLLLDGQAASLAIGPVVLHAVAAGDAETEIHPVVHVCLTHDRRAVSDAAAQRYMEQWAIHTGSV